MKLNLVLLAAGIGKRLKPITSPKPLLPFLNQTLIEHIVDGFKVLKYSQLVIVVNPSDQDQFRSLFPKAKIVCQPKPTGMADALLSASQYLTGPSLIANADDLLDPKIIKDFNQVYKKNSSTIILPAREVNQYFPGAYYQLKNNQPVGLVEKPGEGKEPSHLTKAVLDYFPKPQIFLDQLVNTKTKNDDLYEVALNFLFKTESIKLNLTSGWIQAIKYPWHVLDITDRLLETKLKNKTKIDPSAKIMVGAVIKNSYIGPNVTIGNNVLVRDSIVEAGCVVGYNTEIARSYVGPNNYFHCNYIGDSVIEADSNFGSGTRLANWRFDSQPVRLKYQGRFVQSPKTKLGAIVGRGAKFGINSSLMPGVTVNSQALVPAGQVINKVVVK